MRSLFSAAPAIIAAVAALFKALGSPFGIRCSLAIASSANTGYCEERNTQYLNHTYRFDRCAKFDDSGL